jgi:hypothetical protein
MAVGLVGRNFTTAPPLVVPKSRTSVIGGQAFGKETITFDIQAQGMADLQWMLRSIAAKDTAQQMELGNPPSAVIVDNNPGKGFDDAKKRIVVHFGTILATTAMRVVESTLRQNIERATVARTGRLRNVSGAWRWRLITPGGGSRVVTAGQPLPTFVRGSILVLEPYGVPHATRVNSLVLGKGSLKAKRASRLKKGEMGPPKPKQPVGFLRATVEALRNRAEFRDFALTVAFSKLHMVPGELHSERQGTGSIVIQLKRATARR